MNWFGFGFPFLNIGVSSIFSPRMPHNLALSAVHALVFLVLTLLPPPPPPPSLGFVAPLLPLQLSPSVIIPIL
jgi:hypothetical protein